MGCASSKTDINDQHPNIFQVMNVDDEFRPISPGQIEITDTELIFYQRTKKPTTWSLRNLRKYGFDSEIFSFECGRRCATGEGIFAFKCKKAEQLFNLLQHNIQVRNMSEEGLDVNSLLNMQQSNQNQREVQRRSAVNSPEGYLNPVNNGTVSRPPLSRPGSITSNGPTTPPPNATNPQIPHPETNNNKSSSGNSVTVTQNSSEHAYLNSEVINQTEVGHQYINLPNGDSHPNRNVYMNIDTMNVCNITTPVKPLLQSVTIEEISHETEDIDENNVVETIILPQFPLSPLPECQSCLEDVHCYANIDANALALADCYDPSSGNINGVIGGNFVIDEPQEVNYVELDLEPSGCGPVSVSKTRPLSGDSPVKGKPYVTIDFKKTDALSNSINPRLELEEGCRKTRHNSTIGDIRHSSSISD